MPESSNAENGVGLVPFVLYGLREAERLARLPRCQWNLTAWWTEMPLVRGRSWLGRVLIQAESGTAENALDLGAG
jgi:hypothetical protein